MPLRPMLVLAPLALASCSAPDAAPTTEGEGARRSAQVAADPRVIARAQMHHNPNRGIPYVPLSRGGQSDDTGPIQMRVLMKIELDGDPIENVRGNVYPIDVRGDGKYAFVHFNGYRTIRVYREDGTKAWEVRQPGGRLHRDPFHRDTLAVLDVDDDGAQEIVHCWTDPPSNERLLVVRRGTDGSVIRSRSLPSSKDEECQLAALRVEGRAKPILLVSLEHADRNDCPGSNHVDNWARTMALDLKLNPLWDENTCYAGHYVYPVDTNGDGAAEHVFIGRHLYDPDGTRRCTLPGWGQDHADTVAVADLDTTKPGLEAVVTGRTGMRAVRVPGCQPLWSHVGSGPGDNPQHQALAMLDPASDTPTLSVRTRTDGTATNFYMLDGKGAVLKTITTGPVTDAIPIQNANIDGAEGSDDLVTAFGRIVSRHGNLRANTSWYWGLRGTKTSAPLVPTGGDANQWALYPGVHDVDGDGRDDIITWSQSLIVVGTAAN